MSQILNFKQSEVCSNNTMWSSKFNEDSARKRKDCIFVPV